MAEETVWSGTPSQAVNFGSYIFWLILAVFTFGLTLLIIFWKWMVIKNTKYELTTERFKTRTGILNKKVNELELYRVKDYSMDQPFFLSMFSLANIILNTSDKSNPQLTIRAISDAETVREKIRSYVQACRVKKGVRETDFAPSNVVRASLGFFEAMEGYSLSTAIICPHCGKRGCVATKRAKAKKGISGAKATGALLTAGLSILATGLSRKEWVTDANCKNCGALWQF